MKLLVAILLAFAAPITSSATEQEDDLLIIGNDTVYLKTFILEKLELKYPPFGNTRETAHLRLAGEVIKQYGELRTISFI